MSTISFGTETFDLDYEDGQCLDYIFSVAASALDIQAPRKAISCGLSIKKDWLGKIVAKVLEIYGKYGLDDEIMLITEEDVQDLKNLQNLLRRCVKRVMSRSVVSHEDARLLRAHSENLALYYPEDELMEFNFGAGTRYLNRNVLRDVIVFLKRALESSHSIQFVEEE